MTYSEIGRHVVGEAVENMGEVLGLITYIAAPVFPLSSGALPAYIVAVLVVLVSALLYAVGEFIERPSGRWSLTSDSGGARVGRKGLRVVLSGTHTVATIYWMAAVLLVLTSVMSWAMSAMGQSIG